MAKFTKADLKVGYVVELRNGSLCMVLPTTDVTAYPSGLCLSGKDWFALNALDAELKCVEPNTSKAADYDVMKVYGFADCTYSASKIGTTSRHFLWARKEPKKMTVKNICEALGYDVEIVKEADSDA